MIKIKSKLCRIILNETLWGIIIGGLITFFIQYYTINTQNSYNDKIVIVKTYPELKTILEEQYRKYINLGFDLFKAIDQGENNQALKEDFIKTSDTVISAHDQIILFVLGYTKNDLTKEKEFADNIRDIKKLLLTKNPTKSLATEFIISIQNLSIKKTHNLEKMDSGIKSTIKNF